MTKPSIHQLAVASKLRLKVNIAKADTVSLLFLLLFYAVKQRRGKNSLQGQIKVAPKTFFAFRQQRHWTSSCNEVNGQTFRLELLRLVNWLSKLFVVQFSLWSSLFCVQCIWKQLQLHFSSFLKKKSNKVWIVVHGDVYQWRIVNLKFTEIFL